METFRVGPYELRWEQKTVRAEPYDFTPHYTGVVFFANQNRYDVVANPLLGPRLIITSTVTLGGFRDVPFHQGTVGLLPKGIEVFTPR